MSVACFLTLKTTTKSGFVNNLVKKRIFAYNASNLYEKIPSPLKSRNGIKPWVVNVQGLRHNHLIAIEHINTLGQSKRTIALKFFVQEDAAFGINQGYLYCLGCMEMDSLGRNAKSQFMGNLLLSYTCCTCTGKLTIDADVAIYQSSRDGVSAISTKVFSTNHKGFILLSAILIYLITLEIVTMEDGD